MSETTIIRGVRVMTPEGIAPATVHIREGRIAAVAGYEELPREAIPVELGKSVLMPAMVLVGAPPVDAQQLEDAARCGVGVWAHSEPPVAPSDPACAPLQQHCMEEAHINWHRHQLLSEWLPRLWTSYRNDGRPIEEVGRTLCSEPAAALGLVPEHGQIAAGARADLVVWDPEHAVEAKGSDSLYGNLRKVMLGGQWL